MPTPADTPSNAQLERVMGVRALTASSVNMTVGSGIFLLPAAVYALIGGAAPVAYVICAFAMALVVLCFAEAGSRVHSTGGGYAYARAAFGPLVGTMTGALLYVGAGVLAGAAVMNAFVGTVAVIFPAFGSIVPRVSLMILTYGILATVNIRGARPGVHTMEIFSLGKLLPLFALAGIGIFFMHPANLAIPAMPPVGEMTRACVVLIFAFLGFENSLNPSGEVKDPHRTVPRAVLLALTLVTVLYLTIQMVAVGVLGPQLAKETAAPLAAVAGVVFGRVGSTIILLGTLVSTLGYLTGDALTSPRALYAFSEQGVLPQWLAGVHPAFRTPYRAIIIHAMLLLTLAATGSFQSLIVVANVAVLLMYAIVAAGVLMLRRKGVRGEGAPFVVPGGPVVPVLAVLVLVRLIASATAQEFMATAVTLAAAAGLHFASRMWRPAVRTG
jgi:amino acid transporter